MNKYQQTPEYILDLHGMTRGEAKTALCDLLYDKKYRHIRIITGKGTFRENGGVLRFLVKSFLQENNIRFNPSKIADGGEGSFEIYF